MQKIFTLYLPGIGLLLLLAATFVLASYNFNTKVQSLILTGIIVGTATTFVTLVVGLKPTTIERSFITSVVMNEAEHLPIFVANPSTTLEQRLSKLMTLGRPMRRNSSGASILSLQAPSNFDETIMYAGELTQYAIFRAIQEMHLKSEGSAMRTESGHTFVEPMIHRPMLPPFKKKFFKKDLENTLAQNRFSNSEMEDFNWENTPLVLPEGTVTSFEHIPTSPETGPETYKLILRKPQFFEIEFIIKPSLIPGQGAVPRGISLSPEMERQSRVYYFVIDMKAILPGITAENPHREEYKNWIEWVLAEVESRLT